MTRKYSLEFIDRLLDGTDYGDLVELAAAMSSTVRYRPAQPDYGLPPFAFLFVEVLGWFATGIRSGVWPYYEATPPARQAAMAKVLRDLAPEPFAMWYARGMAGRRDDQVAQTVNAWIDANDEAAHHWLRSLARTHREDVLDLTAW